ncbi:MAG: recombinase RecT, partial [Actinomycetales bacterium]|nr:recombinase RecT [Actinomycetales bacterium]
MSELAKTMETKPATVTVADRLNSQQDGLSDALAGRIGVERFMRAAVTSFNVTPALQRCEWGSVLGALFVAAQLGLEVGGPRGLADIVPFGNQATLVVGYKGYIELFYRAGAIKVEGIVIREGDNFRQWSSGRDGKDYEWTPLNDDMKRPLVGVIAQVKLASGDFQFEHMTREQVEARRPKNWERTPWGQWFDQMALKTVMRQLAKTVRTSTDDLAIAERNDG